MRYNVLALGDKPDIKVFFPAFPTYHTNHTINSVFANYKVVNI